MAEFWIGDWVKINSTDKIGKFEGEVNGKAKIKIGDKLILVSLSKLSILEEDLIPQNVVREVKVINKENPVFKSTIDLHIEKLAPSMKNERAELIISFQVKSAKKFIDEVIKKRLVNATIIHGKGLGAMKMEVMHLLKSYDEVYFTKEVNNGGAIEILFQYY